MNLNIEFFIRFLRSVIEYSDSCQNVIKHRDEAVKDAKRVFEKKICDEINRIDMSINSFAGDNAKDFEIYRSESRKALDNSSKNRENVFKKIDKYQKSKREIEKNIAKIYYDHQYKEKVNAISPMEAFQHLTSIGITADNLSERMSDFSNMITNLNRFSSTQTGSNKFIELCKQIATFARGAESILEKAIGDLKAGLFEDKPQFENVRTERWNEYKAKEASITKKTEAEIQKFRSDYVLKYQAWEQDRDKSISDARTGANEKLKNLRNLLLKKYPPTQVEAELFEIRKNEPIPMNYKCASKNPKCVKIGELTFSMEKLNLSKEAKYLLRTYYPLLTEQRENQDGRQTQLVTCPDCVCFDGVFNYHFKANKRNKAQVIDSVRSIIMRLFMMIPPNKVNFTFFDPVLLGETFAPFARLVEVDDRTSKVINGKIWTSPGDIEDKLRTTTDHIANINQRCLQGKYENIQDYNDHAGQNAEAYRIITIMDFPASFTEHSLKLLEQIVATGPKCGVFTVIISDEEQYKNCDERRIKPLVDSLMKNLTQLNTVDSSITFADKMVSKRCVSLEIPPFLSNEELNAVVPVLKKGIKSSDRIILGIDMIEKNKENLDVSNDSSNGIRIPIGFHGANEIQHLTLGVGGSHHALIAGVAGAGKSSLIHTIIFRALTQYDPDNLQIYLVDFKRGVEFKIYADHKLPSFKVVAIESEREFGFNILMELEREQKIRANKFKKCRTTKIDRIEDYCEQVEKIPRILVIMDEFHELFGESDSLAKRSAQILERIVRQGRAFGIHLILASQSYTNIKGIDKAVFDQMAVRIVLKCSKGDANMLLDDGGSAVEMIPIDDPGRAIYNSEAGSSEFNSHFRVAYINPKKHNEMLEAISEKYASFYDEKNHTRILLTNIEDNQYSIFNRFADYQPGKIADESALYVGETMNISDDMHMVFSAQDNANLLVVGNDSDKARSIFVFSALSLCINYYVTHPCLPVEPYIYIINYKPLNDSYFEDILKNVGIALRPYIKYISSGNESAVKDIVAEMYSQLGGRSGTQKKYLMVFGYQRAEELKSTVKLYGDKRIRDAFGIMADEKDKSYRDMFSDILRQGAQVGIHTIIWQDSFTALDVEDRNFASFFNLKIAFEMSEGEYSRFVGENNTELLGENNAIFYDKTKDNQKFRPYQMPNEEWVDDICRTLVNKPENTTEKQKKQEEKAGKPQSFEEQTQIRKSSGAASFFDL